jgi:hypothetical protein
VKKASRILALSTVVVLAACGAPGKPRPPLGLPIASTFKAGTCHDAAEQVLALGAFAYRRDGAKTLTTDDRAQLARASTRLAALRTASDRMLDARLGDLLTAIGFVRLRVGKTYDPQLLRDMENERLRVQELCTASTSNR